MTPRKVTLHLGPYDGATTLVTSTTAFVNNEVYVEINGRFVHMNSLPKTK